jgi:hypothetical protein
MIGIKTKKGIGEVEEKDENEDKKGDLAENTGEGKAILFVSCGMWGVVRPYQ